VLGWVSWVTSWVVANGSAVDQCLPRRIVSHATFNAGGICQGNTATVEAGESKGRVASGCKHMLKLGEWAAFGVVSCFLVDGGLAVGGCLVRLLP
jgi:hypothetical protein